MKITHEKNNLIVTDIECFNLALSVDCGQSFRWIKTSENTYTAIAYSKKITVSQCDGKIIFWNTTQEDFNLIWKDYFDLETDYKTIVGTFGADAYLSQAVNAYYGVRILNQEPWEALCSFIISQNNNIPRIKGIISRLCETFGEEITKDCYTFPTAERLAALTVEDLAPIRAGFRAKYIIDAAQKVSGKEIDIYKLSNLPLKEAQDALIKIKGVGPKVADCVLLYGCKHYDAFPLDVWMKRILTELYGEKLPNCDQKYMGIAQQYLFHWRRNLKI